MSISIFSAIRPICRAIHLYKTPICSAFNLRQKLPTPAISSQFVRAKNSIANRSAICSKKPSKKASSTAIWPMDMPIAPITAIWCSSMAIAPISRIMLLPSTIPKISNLRRCPTSKMRQSIISWSIRRHRFYGGIPILLLEITSSIAFNAKKLIKSRILL